MRKPVLFPPTAEQARARIVAKRTQALRAAEALGEVDDATLRAFMALRVREARESIGMSQSDLGALAGLSDVTITHIETARQFPSHRLLWTLAQATKKPVGWFYGDQPEAGFFETFFGTAP